MNTRDTAAYVLSLALVAPAWAADWPQYAGPNFNRSTAEKIQNVFPAGGPKALWRVPASDGFSSFAVSGGKAFTQVLRDFQGAPRETLIALDASTGKELWAVPLGPIKVNDGGEQGTADNKGGDGPRSTPSVDGNRVYVTSAKLLVSCFDAATGAPVWSHDLVKRNAGRNISWQNAASPLIEGNLVFGAGGGPGESLIAFDKATGKVAWKAHDEKMTHASPTAATILGRRQIIYFTQSGLVSVNPTDASCSGSTNSDTMFRPRPRQWSRMTSFIARQATASAQRPRASAKTAAISKRPNFGEAPGTSRSRTTGARRFITRAISTACSASRNMATAH